MTRLDQAALVALFIVDMARRDAAAKGRLPRTHALRLALAHLHARSNGDRVPFDRFWRTYADDFARFPRPVDALNHRNTELTQSWRAMLQALGLAESPALMDRLEKLAPWQGRENEAVLKAAIGDHRRAVSFAKDARECFSPNGHSLPKLMPNAKG